MNSPAADIVYTYTDEAPALATHSWLPIVQAYLSAAKVSIETADISLAARILAAFDRGEDVLAQLGELAKQPHANIIKLPNISASIPQLQAAIAELQAAGFDVPDFPSDPKTDADREIRKRYAGVLGSAVNPVLREGNSDRRVAAPVKRYAQSHPHSMGQWRSDSPARVAHMTEGDFFGSEQSCIVDHSGTVRIVHTDVDGNQRGLFESLRVEASEVIDAAVMNVAALREFYAQQIESAKRDQLLLSLHLKATMMKVSDPILFGHAVSTYFADVFAKHADALEQIDFDPDQGIASLETKLEALPVDQAEAIRTDMQAAYEWGPDLAMVDSDRGITNLHVPSDVIIDASMPAAIRAGGQMWGADGQLHPTLAMIPDRCYAGVYQATMDFCREHGAFDVSKMGTVNNVGLMAKKAEEYGSHNKTFEIESDGTVAVLDANGAVLMQHDVHAGDIWRMCQTQHVAIADWVRLAVQRARQTGWPAVFWLDDRRAHDANLMSLIETALQDIETDDVEIQTLPPIQATHHVCQRAAAGENTIAVTGNVLRDYLTDLFPILELGTSAKMLSIVPLLDGGGLFETGAGGSAPKHVQQLISENHLRWDSLGEFLALAVSLDDLARKQDNAEVRILAECLDRATETFLNEDRSPGRSVGQLDTRGSHFYMALYWAEELAAQVESPDLVRAFEGFAKHLRENERQIVDELSSVQGSAVDLGGYYRIDRDVADKVMRPSDSFNAAIERLQGGLG
ncbi:MAG: NADP-dependent isocitrate dehydrogenase [Planctomycetota bacterium]